MSKNGTEFVLPPVHRLADFAEIVVLSVMLFIGCPLNLISLTRSLNRIDRGGERSKSLQSSASKERPPRRLSETITRGLRKGRSSRVFALILHLTVANLMILLIYGVSQICWLITYNWRAGDWACRMIKFLHALCFYGTSNLMVAIAFERLYIAVNVDRPRSWGGSSGRRRCMQTLPWIGWVLAFISAIPQFFLWSTYAPYADSHPEWQQCVDIWTITSSSRVSHANKTSTERVYVGIHLALVFWLPALVIVLCYALIVARLDSKLQRNYSDLLKSRRQCDAVQFRQRAEKWHRASTCSADGAGKDDTGRRQSVLLLMEMPIVVESPRVFSAPVERRSLISENANAILVTTLTRARRSALTKMTCVLFAYIICWAPYNVMALWRYIEPNRYSDSGLEYLYNFIVLNAVINPLLYGC